ncbi:MAG TPA: hypothetical protein VM597_05550 [Gemmataceae bacterium]|jgi:hypothetical protein|nr:hypothetical protein [Gemmataceae bacterium]
MVPLSTLLYPLLAIAICGLYAAYHRAELARGRGPAKALRDRVTYMLWVAADRT